MARSVDACDAASSGRSLLLLAAVSGLHSEGARDMALKGTSHSRAPPAKQSFLPLTPALHARMSSSDEAEAGDSLFGDFFVNKSYVHTSFSFGEGAALRTLRLQVRLVARAASRTLMLPSRRCPPRLAPTTT